MPTLIVNKRRIDVGADVPGDTPLLWVLRDNLNLTGTKYGCGMALCGACTVHIDGAADALVPDAAVVDQGGRRDHDDRGPEDEGGAGGAGCLGEARRAAVRLLPVGPGDGGGGAAREEEASPPTPTSTQAMAGNLCRCATYVRIRAAIQEAAKRLA